MSVTTPAVGRTIATPANAVTALRIALSPALVVAVYFSAPSWWVLAFGFCAMYTDRIDGWLARRYGVTKLGTFLDPLADKVMVLGALGALVALGMLWWLPFVLIVAREFAMSWYRTSLARKGISVPARKLAKIKTWSQSIVVGLAVTPGLFANFPVVLSIAVWTTVALTLYTFVQYMQDGYRTQKSDASVEV